MSSAVQGMPRVMSDSELTTGLTKANPVVMPDKMPMTTLNLDLDGEAKLKSRQKKESAATLHSKNSFVETHEECWGELHKPIQIISMYKRLQKACGKCK